MPAKNDERPLRKITKLGWGPAPDDLTKLNNALYLIEEFVSIRRLSTLAVVPSREDLADAIDTYLAVTPPEHVDREQALALRAAVTAWQPGSDVPQAICLRVREMLRAGGLPEPPCGWDNDTGYADVWAGVTEIRGSRIVMGGSTQAQPDAAREAEQAARLADDSRRASDLAQSMCQMLNLAAAFASPRVLKQATTFPPRAHVVEHLDGFAATLAGSSVDDRSHAALARLRDACVDWTPGPEAPPEVQQAARFLLSAVGCPEPPGGWDAFEGATTPADDGG